MRFKKSQEKRKDEDNSQNFHKSLKVKKIAKDLEDTLNKRAEKETIEHENDDNSGNTGNVYETRRRRFQKRIQDEN